MFRWKKRPASEGGGFLVTQLDYAARKQDEQRAAAAAAAPSRPGLTAPDEWSRGEITVEMNVWNLIKERELKLGPLDQGNDVDLDGYQSREDVDQQLLCVVLLHLAVNFNRSGNVRTLLAAGADAGHYYGGQSPLFLAARLGHILLVRMLHEKNASLDHPAVTDKGHPVLAPLHAAAARGHTNVR